MKSIPLKYLITGLIGLTLSTVGFVVWQTSTSAEVVSTPQYELLISENYGDAEQTVYAVQLADNGQILKRETLVSTATGDILEKNNRDSLIFIKKDGTSWMYAKSPRPSDAQIETWTTAILSQAKPLSGPREFQAVPNTQNNTIFVMTGSADNNLNIYLLDENEIIQQLTDSTRIVPTDTLILSSSVDFIAWRPAHAQQFLYRIRVRDAEGNDTNELYLYDLKTSSSSSTPYFGKDPVWSPDGQSLIGARFNAETELYELYQENLLTETTTYLDNGCNPQVSADGLWLAYDEHTSSHHQNYVDCFASGNVKIMELSTQDEYILTKDLNGYTQILGWQK